MKIGILTSSRADYGIYYPLLVKLKEDNYFDLRVLVFGTHLSKKYGLTVNTIENDGFKIGCRIKMTPRDDSPSAISNAISKTIALFTTLWHRETFDLIIALGDRYEMFAAVISTVPFNIPVAHIHGGETTLGAIDNSFRHGITAMSKLHFTACEEYKKRVIDITGSAENVFDVGALSIDLLDQMKFLTKEEFLAKYKIDLQKPTVLFTFHPETVSYQKNKEYIKTIIDVMDEYDNYQFVITMPNADTMGNTIRESLTHFIARKPNAFGVESFGSLGYLSCMKHCSFMMGNTSSGFIEASFFPKPVINLGVRQKGRIETPNIYTCSIHSGEIKKGIKWAEVFNDNQTISKYGKGQAALAIVKHIKAYNTKLD